MDAVGLLVRSLLRRRWRSYLAIALLVGIGGSAALAAGAAARRTLSAYPAYVRHAKVSDLSVITGPLDSESASEFSRLDAVLPRGSAIYGQINVGPVGRDGAFDLDAFPFVEQVGSVDGRYLDQDRVAVTRGRLPDPEREDEVIINEVFADQYDVDVGQGLSLATAPADPGDNPGAGFELGPLHRFKARVVGVGLLPAEVVQDDIDRVPRIIFTPALTAPNIESINYAWQGLRLRGGGADVKAVERELTARAEAAGLEGILFQEQSAITEKVQRSVRPLAASLGLFAGIMALTVAVLGGLALSRQLTFERVDQQTLRGMGMGPLARAAPGVIVGSAAVVVGLALAVLGALALSPVAPMGRVRKVDVDPGVALDVTAVIGGAAALGAVLFVLLVVLAERSVRRPGAESRAEPSRIANAAAGIGAPATVGIRMALEPGRGAGAVPVRINLAALVTAVVVVVTAISFSASLDRLIARPELFGAPWDGAIVADGGYGAVPLDRIGPALDEDPRVTGWGAAGFARLQVGQTSVPSIGFVVGSGGVAPPVLRGRLPGADDEVLLAQSTYDDVGVGVGERVAVRGQRGTRQMTVVGVGVLPAIGPVFAEHTGPGTGALVTGAALARIDGGPQSRPGMVVVRLRGGGESEQDLQRVADALPQGEDTGAYDVFTDQRPADITNAGAMGAAPATLAAVLGLAAVVALTLTVAVSTRRRRRDLAVMKVLGFTRRQLATAVAWQATASMGVGVVVGTALGIVAGRWLWRAFAEQLNVVPDPSTPLLLLGAIAGGLIAAANLVAAPVGRIAARVPAASVLRSE